MESLPAREATPSPLRPLLLWMGPWLAMGNVCLVPCFATVLSVSFSRAFYKGPTPPPIPVWLPLLQWLSFILTLLIPVQVFFVTLCFTWSPGSYWRRFVQHWSTVLAGVLLLLAGVVLVAAPELFKQVGDLKALQREITNLAAVFASLPILLLGVQTPFWLARYFFGCRLERAHAANQPEATMLNDSLTLRDLFVATALIGLSLGLLQFSDGVNAEAGNTKQAFLFMMLLAAAICGGISLVVGLPLAILFLALSDLRLAWGMTLAAAGSFGVGFFCVSHFYFTPTPKPAETLASCCLLIYVVSSGIGLGLTLLRHSGWQMVTRWSDKS